MEYGFSEEVASQDDSRIVGVADMGSVEGNI